MAYIAISSLCLALCACSLRISEGNIVIPQSGSPVTQGQAGEWAVEALSLAANDATLRGARYTRVGSVATVLYFGGNGFQLAKHQAQLLASYADAPVDVVVFDHRGYGGSGGDPTMEQLYRDGVAIYDWVHVLAGVRGRPLIVHGHSLGSFVAGQVSSRRRLDGLVLEATATTSSDWLAGRVPLLGPFGKALAWTIQTPDLRRQGNANIAKQLDEPTLFVVGERDVVTRPRMARALYAKTSLPDADKRLVVVPGATHMNASRSEAFARATRWLLARSGAPEETSAAKRAQARPANPYGP